MNKSQQIRVLCATVFSFVTLTSYAQLIPKLDGQAVYDTDRDITWAANANLAASMPLGLEIGVLLPPHDDWPPGVDGEYFGGGVMNGTAALHWIDRLNEISYLGFNDWRLPWTLVPDSSCEFEDSTGFNCTGSEMGHLFYEEFRAEPVTRVLDTGDPVELAKFSNLGHVQYLSGWFNSVGWLFFFNNGHQSPVLPGEFVSNYKGFVWPVRDGDPFPTRFNDVPADHWAFSFIETLADSGITAGCDNDNYCPSSPVTRAQMAVFLERGIHGSGFSPPAATGNVFLDVGANDFAASFIEQLSSDGITSGCGNNNYCPNADVTRAQMAVFLLRARHGSDYSPPPASGVFGDVDLSHWAVHWIEQLAAEGITSGCGNGNYCPNEVVTRDQMAVFLVRTFGL